MDGFENLTDEEIAVKLHLQYMSEQQSTVEKEDEDTKLARLLQQQFDQEASSNNDFEFAKSLQQQFESESVLQHNPTPYVQTTYKPSPAPSQSYSPLPAYTPALPVYSPVPQYQSHPSHQPRAKRQATASAGAIKRLRSDTQAFAKLQNPTIFINPDEHNITFIEALIIGPEDTPYDGGFFHFEMEFPDDYPWNPPKVKLTTTDNGRCRFNPNLYADGKVCLSILGTWSGPAWTAVQTCLSTLQSIQSLMNPTPYHNEPGYENERNTGDIADYNDCIVHETIRVAVVGVLNSYDFDRNPFKKTIEEEFEKRYDKYVSVCEKNMSKDGTAMRDPFGESRGSFQYKYLLSQLRLIRERLSPSLSS
eukprot:TRINITY_DN4451_c0_g1_i1.p1 TRINITY_DN4451_c0_g1~~TRINITY_DN4451_c0_g1_i1.p1  ORF type:complete len:363 (+),score=78.67 TRINITY_DN4451_c0_g1_i1:118-1206(+)